MSDTDPERLAREIAERLLGEHAHPNIKAQFLEQIGRAIRDHGPSPGTEEEVEAVAKAMYERREGGNTWPDAGEFWHGSYRDEARAAIAAMAPHPTLDEQLEAAMEHPKEAPEYLKEMFRRYGSRRHSDEYLAGWEAGREAAAQAVPLFIDRRAPLYQSHGERADGHDIAEAIRALTLPKDRAP